MNDKNFYKDTFSQIHSKKELTLEEYKKKKLKRKYRYRLTVAAASIGIILVTSSSVYASNLFGLKDMLLRNISTIDSDYEAVEDNSPDITSNPATSENSSEDNAAGESPSYPYELISLQGFADSNESKAVAEWTRFCENYDQDGSLLAQVGNGPTGLDSRYDLYLVYTQEMADKLEQIVKKYDLSLHSSITDITSNEELLQYAGSGNFLGTANTAYSTYMYEDGTFHFDGAAALDNGVNIDYQFMNCKKGSFTDTILNIGKIEDYKEWRYKTTNDITVDLAISPDKSLIIVDLGSSFITVNVLAGTESGFLSPEGKITAADLEAFTDSFDFSLMK